MTLTNSTVADTGGLVTSPSDGPIYLRNSIVKDICSGNMTSEGYNLLTSCVVTGDITGNITGVDPNVGPLQDNGGPTFTRALLSGSLAIDAGNPAGCTDVFGNPLTTDQRGFTRPTDGDSNGSAICDIGAYEFGAVMPTATPTPVGTPAPTATPTYGVTHTPTPSSTPVGSGVSKLYLPFIVRSP